MLEIKLYLTWETTLDDLRSFVKMTEKQSGDQSISRSNENYELDSIGVLVDNDGA